MVLRFRPPQHSDKYTQGSLNGRTMGRKKRFCKKNGTFSFAPNGEDVSRTKEL